MLRKYNKRKCTMCGRFLYNNETTQEHLEVCGGITDGEAELIDYPEDIIECCEEYDEY